MAVGDERNQESSQSPSGHSEHTRHLCACHEPQRTDGQMTDTVDLAQESRQPPHLVFVTRQHLDQYPRPEGRGSRSSASGLLWWSFVLRHDSVGRGSAGLPGSAGWPSGSSVSRPGAASGVPSGSVSGRRPGSFWLGTNGELVMPGSYPDSPSLSVNA